MKLADFFGLVRDAAVAFGQDKAPRLAAAIAFFATVSLGPIMVLLVTIAGFFLGGNEEATQRIVDALTSALGNGDAAAPEDGQGIAGLLETMISNAFDAGQRGVALAIGIAGLMWTSSNLFMQIQGALNTLWGVEDQAGIGSQLRTRATGVGMVVAFGFLIVLFLAFNVFMTAIAQNLGDAIGFGALFVQLASLILGALFLVPVFGAIYKFIPNVNLQWREVWFGAIFTAVLFIIGQRLIGFYFSQAAPASAYGAAGSLFAVLLWIQFSAMIFMFGAELTWAYSQRYGTQQGASRKNDLLAGMPAAPRQGMQPLVPARRAMRAPVVRERLRVTPPRPEPKPTVRHVFARFVLSALALPSMIVLRLFGLKAPRRELDLRREMHLERQGEATAPIRTRKSARRLRIRPR